MILYIIYTLHISMIGEGGLVTTIKKFHCFTFLTFLFAH